ncbi:hypothetical protein [Kribbella endophytica]
MSDSRWPHAFIKRRIPSQTIHGTTGEVSSALRLAAYLDEIERQSRIFTRSFSNAMDAALVDNDAEESWRELQSAVFAAIVINRIVDFRGEAHGWPGCSKAQATRIAVERSEALRGLLSLPEPEPGATRIFEVRKIRNAMEHIDERLDRTTSGDEVGGFSDWYLSDGMMLVTPAEDARTRPPLGLRAFIPEVGQLFFGDDHLNMFSLDLDILQLQHQINEARRSLAGRIRGPMLHGGGKLMAFADESHKVASLATWTKERSESLDRLEQTGLRNVKLWLQAKD